MLGIFNICGVAQTEIHFSQEEASIQQFLFPSNMVADLHGAGDRDVVQPSACHRQVTELMIQLCNVCIFLMEMNETNHSIPVCKGWLNLLPVKKNPSSQ